MKAHFVLGCPVVNGLPNAARSVYLFFRNNESKHSGSNSSNRNGNGNSDTSRFRPLLRTL